MARLLGYARTSSSAQRLDLQLRALEAAGCHFIFSDHGRRGTGMNRAGLLALLEDLQPGDVVLVWRLDRLSRLSRHLMLLRDRIKASGATLKTINERIDTSTPDGDAVFHLVAGLVQHEHDIASQRVTAGLDVARSRGRGVGRPRKLTDREIADMVHMRRNRRCTMADLAAAYDVHIRTVERNLASRA